MKSQAVLPENGPREKNNKAANGGVFKVGDLELARPDERDDDDDDENGDVEEGGGGTHLNSTLQPILSPGGGGLNLGDHDHDHGDDRYEDDGDDDCSVVYEDDVGRVHYQG